MTLINNILSKPELKEEILTISTRDASFTQSQEEDKETLFFLIASSQLQGFTILK